MNIIVRNVAFCPACRRERGANHVDDCVLTPQGVAAREARQATQSSKDVRKNLPPGIVA